MNLFKKKANCQMVEQIPVKGKYGSSNRGNLTLKEVGLAGLQQEELFITR